MRNIEGIQRKLKRKVVQHITHTWLACSVILISAPSLADNACMSSANSDGDTSQAILVCETTLKNITAANEDFVATALRLAKLYQKTGDLNSAERLLQQVIEDADNISDDDKIDSLRQLGVLHFHQRHYEKSYHAFEPALKLAIQTQKQHYIALGYNDLANVYHAYGDLKTASKLLLESYEIHTQVNNELGRAGALNNLGSLYRDQAAYDEAIVALRRSYSIYTEIDQRFRAALTLANLGDTFHLSGDLGKAVELLQQSAKELNGLNAYQSLAEIYTLLAQIHVKQKDVEQAQHWLDEAKLTFSLLHSSTESPKTWYVQGLIWDLQKDYKQASEAYENAFKLIRKDNEFKFQEELYTAMAKLGERTNDYEASSKYWKIYADTLANQRSLKDSMHASYIRSNFSFEPKKDDQVSMLGRVSIATGSAVATLALLVAFNFLRKRRRLKIAQPALQQTAQSLSLPTKEEDQKRSSNDEAPSALVTTTEPNISPQENVQSLGSNHDHNTTTESETAVSQQPLEQAQQASAHNEANNNASSTDNDTNTHRQKLVELMHLALQMWEEQTQSGKLELAQQSKIWSVGIDDGRLRARAMERYFSINTLPQNPRWRTVVRTCNYVLKRCPEKSLYRAELEENLKSFQSRIKRNATILNQAAS